MKTKTSNPKNINPIKRIYRHLTNWRWEIGFLDNTLEGVVNGEPLKVNWVKLPFKERWFADPFILDVTDDDIIVLVEEYADDLLRGRIAKLVIDRRTYRIKEWKIILDKDTHLSFPRVVRDGEKIFIHPENNRSGSHSIYEYDKKNNQLINGRVICDDRLTDAVMLQFNGRDLMFSTYFPYSNGKDLHIYENKGEKYEEVDCIHFSSRIARMAGDFFEVSNQLYRPAQDCNGEYGAATIIQKVIVEDDKWSFEDVRRITSPHPILKLGCHTFNNYNGLIVIDVKGYRYPVIGKLLEILRNPFGKKMKDAKE